jgi:hypothetical protein
LESDKLDFLIAFHFYYPNFFMSIKSDLWLRRMATEQQMIEPFLPELSTFGSRLCSIILVKHMRKS